MTFNSPVSTAHADALIALLDLPPQSTVVDVGCGAGAWLHRIVERYDAAGIGIDPNAAEIEIAKARAPQLDWRCAHVTPDAVPDDSVHSALCVGATHAFEMGKGAYEAALRHLTRWVRPGGRLLVGEGYWQRDPHPDYLTFLGETPGVYRDHAANVQLGVDLGLVPLHASTASQAEWDAFEWGHIRKAEQTGGERQSRARRWRDAYLRWGRGTMGFGFYLFEKPG